MLSAVTLTPVHRTAGALLLLTALATVISVVARLSADADQPTEIASLYAIGAAKAAYATGGAARLVGGIALIAAAIPLRRVMEPYHPRAIGLAAALLAASGIASAVSGGGAIALAALAPGAPSSIILAFENGDAGGAESILFAIRWATGALGFTLAGLALVALASAQWRVGGILRPSAVVVAVLGAAMLFIWVDAATVVHRITGVGFLIWLIAAGLWLIWPGGSVRRPEPHAPAVRK